MIKHIFKTTYLILAVCTIVIDLIQMVLFLIDKMSGLKEVLDDPRMAILSTLTQYMLFLLNCLSLWYFFKREDFGQYMRKVARHEYTYLFLVIFLLRFLDLYFGKGPLALNTHAAYASYLVGVAVKHWTRLSLLQLICYYRFRNDDNRSLMPSWKFLLYISPNLVDIVGNLLRLTIYYAWVVSLRSESGAVTKSDALVFVGEMLYFYYNCLLISAFLLKLKNPTKDVIRYMHKQANADIKVLDYLNMELISNRMPEAARV